MEIQESVPHHVKLVDRPKLGSKYGEQAFQLYKNSIIGETMLDCTNRIRIKIGPLEFEEYLEFIPAGKYASLLNELLMLYLNDRIEYDIKLIIHTEGIAAVPWNDTRLRLGSTIWLGKPNEKFVEINYKFEEYVRS